MLQVQLPSLFFPPSQKEIQLPSIKLILGNELNLFQKIIDNNNKEEDLPSIEDLLNPEIWENDKKRYFCQWKDCRESYTTQTGLATHCSIHVMTLSRKKQECSCCWRDCNKVFPTIRDLVKHLSHPSHIGQTPFLPRVGITKSKKAFSCSFVDCKQSFTDASNRKKHEATHNANRERFYCTESKCIKSYSTKTDLRIHMKVHIGDFPHKCSHTDCRRAFVRRSELYAHERTHDNMLPHLCALCGKGFKDKTKWALHQQVHTL